jgi:hypothetical protein
MATMKTITEEERQVQDKKRMEEETTKYNELASKMPEYLKLKTLDEKCKFWYENRIFLDSTWKNDFQYIKVEELLCYPKLDEEFLHYEEWLLKYYCDQLKYKSYDITVIQNGQFVERGQRKIVVIPFNELVENLKSKFDNNSSERLIIENELKVEIENLRDYLNMPNYETYGLYTKQLYENLISKKPFHELLPKNFKDEAIYKLAIVWDRAKYILYLKKLLENLVNGNTLTKKVAEVRDTSPKDLELCSEFKKELIEPNMTEKKALTKVANKTNLLNGELTSKKDQLRKILIKNNLWQKNNVKVTSK